jgi:hypothetical protein
MIMITCFDQPFIPILMDSRLDTEAQAVPLKRIMAVAGTMVGMADTMEEIEDIVIRCVNNYI